MKIKCKYCNTEFDNDPTANCPECDAICKKATRTVGFDGETQTLYICTPTEKTLKWIKKNGVVNGRVDTTKLYIERE